MADISEIKKGQQLYNIKDKVAREQLATKQEALIFDEVPQQGSNNPAKSGGIYTQIQDLSSNIQEIQKELMTKADQADTYNKAQVNSLVTPPGTIIQVVTSLPAEGQDNTVYRVPGIGSYSDYGWDGMDFVLLATYYGTNLYDTTGQNTDGAMSQKTVTDELQSINFIASPFDLANGGCYAKFSLNGNKWAVNYYSRTYPVVPGRKYIIKANAEYSSIIAVLKTCYPVSGQVMDFAEGYTSRIVLSAGQEITIVMPSDAHYLVVQVTSGSGDITPASVLEYIPRFEYAESIIPDNNPPAGKAVSSSLMALVDLTGAIQYTGTWLNGDNKWSSARKSTIYPVTPGMVCHIKANETHDTQYAFLKSHGQGAGNNAELATGSVRENVIHGTIKEVVAPEDANYLYVYRGTASSDATPEYVKYYKNKIESLEKDMEQGFKELILEGDGANAVTPNLYFKEGRIIKIDIDNPKWKRDSISSSANLLVFNIDGTDQQVLVKKGSTVSSQYFIKTGKNIGFTFRADVGEKVKFTFHDVTDQYMKEVYDIAFVEDTENESMKSMSFRLNMGQKIQYRVLAGDNEEFIKVYSINVQDDTYKIDSVVAGESSELIIGEYLALRSCVVVVKSNIAIGFTPQCKVLEIGEGDKTVKMVEPYQFIVDTENMVTLLASDDEDATEYDNRVINGFSILQVGNKWYMWYMGYGSGSLPNILMAYSSDGVNWTRGIPDGIEEPFEDTNLIFTKGVIVGEFAQECVNEFDVLKVNDTQFPFRMICNIRNASSNSVQGECMYMLKSQDGVHWSTVRKMLPTAHDTFMRSIVYGDIIKVYLRMWDYTQASNNNKRMVGVMHCDINGQVMMPPSGLPNMTRGWYGPYAYRIGLDRELMIPTIYYPNTNDINIYESYICSHGDLRPAPSYGLENLKKETDNDGWGAVYSMLYANGKQYLAYEQGPHKHGETGARSEFRAVPIKWVTYDSSNTDSSIQA